eukprot:8652712-Heterocapsa_arctica.AAC.1
MEGAGQQDLADSEPHLQLTITSIRDPSIAFMDVGMLPSPKRFSVRLSLDPTSSLDPTDSSELCPSKECNSRARSSRTP